MAFISSVSVLNPTLQVADDIERALSVVPAEARERAKSAEDPTLNTLGTPLPMYICIPRPLQPPNVCIPLSGGPGDDREELAEDISLA